MTFCHYQIAKLLFVCEKNSSSSDGDKEDLHEGVVITDEVGEEVQVPADEHQQIQELRFSRDNRATSVLPNLQREPNNGKQMNQVSEKPETVHLNLKN